MQLLELLLQYVLAERDTQFSKPSSRHLSEGVCRSDGSENYAGCLYICIYYQYDVQSGQETNK